MGKLTPEEERAVKEILLALKPLSPQAQRDVMLYFKAKNIQDMRRQIKLAHSPSPQPEPEAR